MAKSKAPTKADLAVQLAAAEQRAEGYRNKLHEEQGARQLEVKQLRASLEMKQWEMTDKVISHMGQAVDTFARMIQDIQNGRHR